jgi:hypothetical protein
VRLPGQVAAVLSQMTIQDVVLSVSVVRPDYLRSVQSVLKKTGRTSG